MTQLDGGVLDSMWDFTDPSASELRFRAMYPTQPEPAAAELQTQIARSLGLQSRFGDAHRLLDDIGSDHPVVQQRIALERGRLLNSDGNRTAAIPFFQAAVSINADSYLTVDAMHMLAIADLDHDTWYEQAMAMVKLSTDERVQRWEGSLRNNRAWNLADDGNDEEALLAFQDAERWFSVNGTSRQLHIGRWSVAHMLRRLGRIDEARTILLELKNTSEPDEFVEKELDLLDES